MTAQIFRFEVPVDDRWHEIAGCSTPLHVDCRDPRIVEFWAWRRDDLPARSFRVYGTGHPVPDGSNYRARSSHPAGNSSGTSSNSPDLTEGRAVNAVQQLAYRYIPSFKREAGGLYNLYVAVYSRAYAARMRYLHKRGRHGRGAPHSLAPRCTWCGTAIP